MSKQNEKPEQEPQLVAGMLGTPERGNRANNPLARRLIEERNQKRQAEADAQFKREMDWYDITHPLG